MSYRTLDDWKRGDPFSASHLQQVVDAARAGLLSSDGSILITVTPSGVVLSAQPQVVVPPGGLMVRITSAASGGGKYNGVILKPPASAPTASGDLTAADAGDDTDATVCLAFNHQERGVSTHVLTEAGNTTSLDFPGVLGRPTADGVPVVHINGDWSFVCTPPE
jgi:hypothetical protein